MVWLMQFVNAKGLMAHVHYPCQVYRHTMRSELAPLAGVSQPVGGRPKVGTGLDIEPPGRRPTCAPPDGLGLVRHPCFFPACTYWPALHGGKPAEGGERRWKWEKSRRARRENRRRTLHCCQVTGGGEAEDRDDGRQRGEASHDSDSDHPVRTCSTGVFHPHAHC